MLEQLDSTLTGAAGNKAVLLKGFVGMGSPALASWISFMPEIEATLRMASLVVGLIVGIATIWSMWYHRNDKK